jgi:dTMP kinase
LKENTVSGKFITFEGIDGAGKSSHIAFVADYLRERGEDVVTTREPGGTPLGEAIREIVLNQKMHGETEALLVFAARREHLAEVIAPALARGAWVVCDRFTDSTYAYQHGGRGLKSAMVGLLEQYLAETPHPDSTFLFDAPVEVARARLDKNTPEPDKFEREQGEFFRRVRNAYLARAAAYPKRIQIVDSAQSMAEIRAVLTNALDRLLADTNDVEVVG